MRDPLRHLPFLLVLFIIFFTGMTDLAIDAGARVLVTVLAPALWLGLYLLGINRPQTPSHDHPPMNAGSSTGRKGEE